MPLCCTWALGRQPDGQTQQHRNADHGMLPRRALTLHPRPVPGDKAVANQRASQHQEHQHQPVFLPRIQPAVMVGQHGDQDRQREIGVVNAALLGAPAVERIDRRAGLELGHARALLALDRATQITAAHQITAKKMSVREAEGLVKKLSAEFELKPSKVAPGKPRDTRRLEEELADLLMAEVEIRIKKQVKRNGRREDVGELAIQFSSMDELNGLIERLRKAP